MVAGRVLGASTDRAKYGNKVLRVYQQNDLSVYPINPKGGEVEGLPVLRSLAELPGPVDQVSLYLPAAIGVSVLDEVAATEHGSFFVNPGAESPELIERARALGRHLRSGLRVGVTTANKHGRHDQHTGQHRQT